MSKRINRDDLEKFHELDVHVPSRTITLFGEISARSAKRFIKNFHSLEQTDGGIHILLNTDGGDQSHGMAIHDVIRLSERHITITVTGSAYSMGSIILQAADRRVVTKYSSVMFHRGEITVNASGDEARNQAEFDLNYSDALDEIIYRRLEKSSAWAGGISREAFKELNRKSTYLRGNEVVEWGLADECV
jgi:ATP-dependent protease ClpP protease subunit